MAVACHGIGLVRMALIKLPRIRERTQKYTLTTCAENEIKNYTNKHSLPFRGLEPLKCGIHAAKSEIGKLFKLYFRFRTKIRCYNSLEQRTGTYTSVTTRVRSIGYPARSFNELTIIILRVNLREGQAERAATLITA
ncbi:hypothetical protein EVAR_51883_1 [Eumeta japonica]|uniref:Uncharacterized protein n=1 Tax=Eumeta variegata TaxID=151549 RepID=A0A4C1YN02_EUMVA|nr:hypothetical protein EVAR_51883_1 [Eumeta japonica]